MTRTITMILVLAGFMVQAQTPMDGFIMPSKNLCAGFQYTHDQWTDYWEGARLRDNGNIGTLSTQSIMAMAAYGITDDLNAIVMLPYVWTKASAGTLKGLSNFQDLSVALKYRFLQENVGNGNLDLFATGLVSTPISNYTPDFLPMSIGLASTNVSGRLVGYYKLKNGLYFHGTGAWTWRSNIRLDRDAYYADGELYRTNEVKMPNMADYQGSIGFKKNLILVEARWSQQFVLGGGDIRPQDMPFPSYRMNASKVGMQVWWDAPWLPGLTAKITGDYVVNGRNVGQSTIFSGSLVYAFPLFKKSTTSQL